MGIEYRRTVTTGTSARRSHNRRDVALQDRAVQSHGRSGKHDRLWRRRAVASFENERVADDEGVDGVDERQWLQGYVFARRAVVKLPSSSEEDLDGTGLIEWSAENTFEREALDEGADGHELTLVSIKVPEGILKQYREPGQQIELKINKAKLEAYEDELDERYRLSAKFEDKKLSTREAILNGGAETLLESGHVTERDFDFTRDDDYSILDRRVLMQAAIEENGDPNAYAREKEISLKDLAEIKKILNEEEGRTMSAENLTIASAPEVPGCRQMMKPVIDFVIPKNARGLGATLLHLPLNSQVLLRDVITSPTFNTTPIKTHHIVLFFANKSGMGLVRSFLDSSWWAHRLASRTVGGIRAHLFFEADNENELPFKEFYDVWSAGRVEVCSICSNPSDEWIQNQRLRNIVSESSDSGCNVKYGGNIRDVLKSRGGLPSDAKNVAAILCGTRELMSDIKNELQGYGVDESRILVWEEEVAWRTEDQ